MIYLLLIMLLKVDWGRDEGIFENPATSMEGVLFSYQRLFNVIDLFQIDYGGKFGDTRIGAGIEALTESPYNELTLSFSYGRIIHGLLWGAGFNYYFVNCEEYGTGGAIGLNMGIKYQRSNWDFHFSILNFNSPHLWKSEIPVKIVGKAGAKVTDRFYFSIYSLKEGGFPLDVQYSVNAKLSEIINLRFRIGTNPVSFGIGFNFIYNKMCFDFFFRFNQFLGFSEIITIKHSL